MSCNARSRVWWYGANHGGPVDFALTEAAYVITRIFRRYPKIVLPDGETVELVGVEKQTTTLVLKSAEGCKVELG